MSVMLARNNYGKSAVRVAKVHRRPDRHEIKDLAVSIQLEGDFARAFTDGDNSMVLPTDTMKNTVYALAAQHPLEPIESFGAVIAAHLLEHCPSASQARVEIVERTWARLLVHEKPHPHAFARETSEERTAAVTSTREYAFVEAGVDELLVMKTAHSAFKDFLKDDFTTLPETDDRLLATVLKATWLYVDSDLAFDGCWRGIRQMLLDVFAEHQSASVQHTLYAMGQSALEMFEEILEIRLSMPNKHFIPFNLAPLGLENKNEIFVPTQEPYGLIEATVRRK
jgi:urate oxidase